jgi:DNA gyrase/topoisomerase IV subunit A
MPSRTWDAGKQQAHDDRVSAVLTQSDEAIRRAKSLIDNFAKIGRHIDGIARTVLEKTAPRKADTRFHAMLARMAQLGKQISRARTRNLTETQIRSLQANLSAIVPLLRENADHAEALARYWKEMHQQLQGILLLFDR